jgi:uncharacterized protein
MINKIKYLHKNVLHQAHEIKELINFKQHRRLAVTGIAGGGKTVFLTSLISHLAEFGQGAFHLGKSVDITDFRKQPVKSTWPPEFTHSNFREDLARGRWPEKTTDCSQYICEFKRSDWKLYTQRLSFFDFPGERVADAAIAAFAGYREWSDHILAHFARHHSYSRAAGPYLEYIDKGKIAEDALLKQYRETLARLILAFKPMVSPSSFLLDEKGVSASPGTPEQIAASRFSGLSFSRQFAPLSALARKQNPDLVAKMSLIYREYRKLAVLPVFEKISRTNSLVVLVDIPSLLAGGVGRYNDDRQILLDLFEVLRPRSDLGALLMKYFAFWYKSLSRIAFVAAKADMVHPMDIDNKRMINLLKMMTSRTRKMLPEIRSEWFVCSACHSTFPVQGQRRLKGRIVYDNPDKEFREYNVPELPEAWPEKWNPGDYPFYRVYPDAPQNYLIPPRHMGLDQVFEFISR